MDSGTQGGWITDYQIEAARIAMTRYMRHEGKVVKLTWLTKKPLEVHMGSGKVAPDVHRFVKNTVMFEVGQVSEAII